MNTYGFELKEIKPNLYKVSGKFTPPDMILSVVDEGGKYRAYCNYKKRTKNAASAYQSNHLTDTAQETIESIA